jgi:hypothetical protein
MVNILPCPEKYLKTYVSGCSKYLFVHGLNE